MSFLKKKKTVFSQKQALAAKAHDRFLELHSDVFIPHPDTNRDERLMYSNQLDDEDKKMQNVEVWDDSDENADEWGSEEAGSDQD